MKLTSRTEKLEEVNFGKIENGKSSPTLTDETTDIDETSESKDEQDRSYFCNRISFSLFAILFLWLTSLQVSTSIASYFIQVPRWSSVDSSCRSALQVTLDEQQLYNDCIGHQMKTCNSQFDEFVSIEKSKQENQENVNNNFLKFFQELETNSSTIILKAQNILSSWSKIHPIKYSSTCANEQFQSSFNLHSTSEYSLLQDINQYSMTSSNRISSIVTYSIALNDYNEEYLQNKTENLKELTLLQAINISDLTLLHVNASLTA
jgi:hypothetical protein